MMTASGTLAAPFRPVVFRGLPIPGYYVSSHGLVWSDKTGKNLKPWAVAGGYLVVGFCCDGKTIRASIHQLVAEAFIGPRPYGFDVCHNDGCPTSNDVSNLRYASRSENLADREKHGTAQHGERNPAAKLTNAQADEIRTRRSSGELLRCLAVEFGVREPAISRIFNGKRRAK